MRENRESKYATINQLHIPLRFVIVFMSRRQKLLTRFLAKPRDFTFDELATLLRDYGYREMKKGKTSGSRAAFIKEKSKHIIRLHKPHPSKILRRYQLDDVERELKRKGFLP
jgi:hypothetical protein